MVEYPEVSWDVWRFPQTPTGYWLEMAKLFDAGDCVGECALREFVERDLVDEYKVKQISDLLKAPRPPNPKKPSSHRLAHFGGIEAVLTQLYPNLQVDPLLPTGMLLLGQ